MNAKRERGFGAMIGREVLEEVGSDTATSTRDQLAKRGAAISKMSSDIVYGQNEWVDPALCKPSKVNARDYQALTYEDCEELIQSIISEGKQRFPATVRSSGDPDTPYEIVAGIRRHWSIAWLRANNYPDFKYLINVQKLDDEAAFRLSDLENRARLDISDLERGRSYKDALAAYYGGDIERMADRLGISSRNLRRYIQLAETDPIIIEALGGHRSARVAHSQTLRSASGQSPVHADLILAEAGIIADEQRRRSEAGEGPIAPAEVVKRLVTASTRRVQRQPPTNHASVEITSRSGKPMLSYVPGTARTGLTVKILQKSDATPDEIKEAFARIVDEVYARRG